MLTIEQARKAVRRSSDAFDDELRALMEAAVLDMKTVGIARKEADALYDQAVRMYLRGNFEPDDPEAAACREIYERHKSTLRHVSGYREEDSE